MSESSHISRDAISVSGGNAGLATLPQPIKVRPPARDTVAALLLLGYFACLGAYLGYPTVAASIFAAVAAIIIAFGITTAVVFDGRRLYRRSPMLPVIITPMMQFPRRMRIREVEKVETSELRPIKRGRNAIYRHRTTFHSKGNTISVTSGSRNFALLLRSVLPLLPAEVLDRRSAELSELYSGKGSISARAAASGIPPADVLEGSLRGEGNRIFPRIKKDRTSVLLSADRYDELRAVARELRVSGSLVRAIESYRRLASSNPYDAAMVFEFAVCLSAFADLDKDSPARREGSVLFRFAERLAAGDRTILEKIVAEYIESGDWHRAEILAGRVTEKFGPSYRSLVQKAEIALNEGKMAHVVLDLSRAADVAPIPALKNWAEDEADYFRRLSGDDDYVALELSRLNLGDSIERSKRMAVNVAVMAIPLMMTGMFFEDSLLADVGWAVSAVAFAIRVILVPLGGMFRKRIAPEMIDRDDN